MGVILVTDENRAEIVEFLRSRVGHVNDGSSVHICARYKNRPGGTKTNHPIRDVTDTEVVTSWEGFFVNHIKFEEITSIELWK